MLWLLGLNVLMWCSMCLLVIMLLVEMMIIGLCWWLSVFDFFIVLMKVVMLNICW